MNPKDLIGSKKISTTILPDTAIFHAGAAMMDGARKYGPFNWRDQAVQGRIYLDAIKRHLALYAAGEDAAEDSGALHLAHVIGCAAILIDAAIHGKLIDDRAKSPETVEQIKQLNALALEMSKRDAAKEQMEAVAKNIGGIIPHASCNLT
jgi:hypothetical protein